MNPITITCPKCNSQVSIDEALSHELQDKITKDLKDEFNRKWLDQKDKLLKQAEDEALKKAEEKNQAQLKELSEELKKAREEELRLRKEKQLIEEEKQKWELDKQRQLDEEREKIQRKTAETLLEEHRMRDLEKNKQMEDMRKKIDELQLKVNLTSQQLQGEVQELELEDLLRREFPTDDILPVGKGVRGADVVQVIRDTTLQECGKIIWESKRTKNWEDGWVTKLKEDMRGEKADIAIIVSAVLPKEIKTFSAKDGVYVTNFECLVSVAAVLRFHLIKLHSTKLLSVGKNEKIESLYRYITSSEFAQKIESMMETYSGMRNTLEKEKNAMVKIWAQREKEIETLKNNTLMIHGSLTGLIGDNMAEVTSLEFPEVEGDTPLFADAKVIES